MWEQWWEAVRRFVGGVEPATVEEDPEVLLERAQEEMRQMHARNRERAVRAITQKNQLEQMVQHTERSVQNLREKEAEARANGDTEKAAKLAQEVENYQQTLELTRTQHEQAIALTEQVKAAIKREEEMIRQRTAHALALSAQWKLVKIEQAITLSLAQISTSGAARLTRAQVQERHDRNREYLVEAVSQKNVLRQMVDGLELNVANLREKSDLARRRGDDTLEHELLRELEQYEATLAQARGALDHAVAVTDRGQTLLREEAERIAALGDAAFTEDEPATPFTPARVMLAEDESDGGLLPLLIILAGLVLMLCVLFLWWLLGA